MDRPLPLTAKQSKANAKREERARREIVAAWRRVDLAEEEGARADTLKPIGSLLPSLLSRLKLEQRRADAEIVNIWNRVVDPDVARNARPVALSGGTLRISVANSVWLAELVRFRQRDILKRLQASLGSEQLKRLSFVPHG